jgi:hypothetical protein
MRRFLAILAILLLTSTVSAWVGGLGGGGSGGTGSGDVVGPSSAVAETLVCFDGSTGKAIKECYKISLPAASIGSSPPMVSGTTPFTLWGTNASPDAGFNPDTLYVWNGTDWLDLTQAVVRLQEDTIFPGILGQTSFTLSQPYRGPGSFAQLAVNGVVMDLGLDYSLSGTTLYWYNIRYQLTTTDELIIKYQVQ